MMVWYGVGVDSEHHDINILDGQRRVGFSGTGYYAKSSNLHERVTQVSEAFALFRQQLERILPRRGQQMNGFEYELRKIE